MDIKYIPIFTSNYIWLMINKDSKQAVAVDPGLSTPVIDFLSKENLTLTDILITHHHSDHVGGVLDLKKRYNPNIYAPYIESVAGATNKVRNSDRVFLSVINDYFEVLDIPGHTLGHVAYYNKLQNILFCGDTLFSAGCGRLFEGNYAELYASLKKLSSLPDLTLVYCTHEYTIENLKFAKLLEPNNKSIIKRTNESLQMLAKGLPTLPSTIGAEKEFNPFLRCHSPDIVRYLENNYGLMANDEEEVFACLRKLKDGFH